MYLYTLYAGLAGFFRKGKNSKRYLKTGIFKAEFFEGEFQSDFTSILENF